MTRDDVIKEFKKIKGIGKVKAETLYDKGYNSFDKLRKATAKELSKIEGITDSIAKDIKDQLMETPVKRVEKSKTKKREKNAKPSVKKEKKAEKKVEPKSKPEKKEEKTKKFEAEKKEIKEVVETVEEKVEEYVVKKKPVLTNKQKQRLNLRKKIKKETPEFLREEWFRYKRIPRNWRRPDGISSKMRMNLKYRPSKVRVGFRGPKDVRGLHSSGFKEVLVYNVNDLENVDPKTQAARIGSSVGTKKRLDIEKKAEELDVRILNL